jgi:hypothetical protein
MFNKEKYKYPLEFVGHIAMAAFVFMVIAFVAAALSFFLHILERNFYLHLNIIYSLKLLEYFIYGCDYFVFIMYIVTSVKKFLVSIWKS